MDEIDRQKKKQKLILLDTLGYFWILFFWILGKFLGSKYPSIYDHPPGLSYRTGVSKELIRGLSYRTGVSKELIRGSYRTGVSKELLSSDCPLSKLLLGGSGCTGQLLQLLYLGLLGLLLGMLLGLLLGLLGCC